MQVEYKTEKGVLLFVKVPDDATNINLSLGNIFHFTSKMQNPMGMNGDFKIIDKGFELIGLTSEVSEEQAKMMVDDSGLNELLGETYKDYTATYVFDTALESLKSLMQHLQAYEVNPYEKPKEQDLDSSFYEIQKSFQQEKQWQEAQYRTGKWILLFKNHEQNNI